MFTQRRQITSMAIATELEQACKLWFMGVSGRYATPHVPELSKLNRLLNFDFIVLSETGVIDADDGYRYLHEVLFPAEDNLYFNDLKIILIHLGCRYGAKAIRRAFDTLADNLCMIHPTIDYRRVRRFIHEHPIVVIHPYLRTFKYHLAIQVPK